jgi:hypothetical protein
MRLLLVQPAAKYPDRRPLRSRTRWLVGITLPYRAGLTPKNVVVDLADDRREPFLMAAPMTWWASPAPAPPRPGPTRLPSPNLLAFFAA